MRDGVCRLCGEPGASTIARITARPRGEVDYHIPEDRYDRTVCHCRRCGAYSNLHNLLASDFYQGQYNADAYRGRMHERFITIRTLPEGASDNRERARRVDRFLQGQGRLPSSTSVLDVGMGLCVFLAEMKDLGYRCLGVDPDACSTDHAREQVGIDACWAGTLESLAPSVQVDLVTLNKVLEHVEDPVRQLELARQHLAPGGGVYVELPDGDLALSLGSCDQRNEFNVEHLVIYTLPALQYLAEAAGFTVTEEGSMVEPSGKATLYGFLTPIEPVEGSL